MLSIYFIETLRFYAWNKDDFQNRKLIVSLSRQLGGIAFFRLNSFSLMLIRKKSEIN